ncbi:MAG: aminotransferase class V-fold PLP-dependent enzyme [Candidatus Aminicenantes bacterium]|nr:aminotransferase class V-fold PLP-dependent enzyme [Candidatus Aminicenantes bacterium]
MDIELFRRHGHEFVDWVAEYFKSVENLPVMSRVQPGDIRKKIPPAPPENGEPMERIFEDFKSHILPGMTHWQHPGWFAYFPANNSPASVLAELLTAGLGAQCMVWQTSPAAAELEETVMDWLRGMIGLPEDWAGVIQDTASTATLCALLSAREVSTGFGANRRGARDPLVVYASTEAHSSVEKAVKIAGLGAENLRLIPVDEHFALIPGRLEEAVAEDARRGLRPCAVVATVGSTSSGAVDPLRAVGEICRRRSLWLHVDAAYAGTAAVLPEMRGLLDGVELADSLVFNPHKWMLTNFDCSAYFVRDPGLLIRTFEVHPEYLKTGRDAVVKNYRDWGIPLGRRFRALKLWFVIRTYGVEGVRSLVREHLRLARLFRSWVEAHPRFELLAPVNLSLVCFRWNDGRKNELELSALNKRLMEAVNDTGKVFLTHTALNGRFTLRLVVGQRTTEERHVRLAWELLTSEAEKLGA